MDIGKRIKAIRKEKRITQQKLAERLGTSRSYVAQVETKPTINLSISSLKRFADALGVSLTALIAPLDQKGPLGRGPIKEGTPGQKEDVVNIPVIGNVTAGGVPILNPDVPETYFPLPRIYSLGEDCFIVRVSGNSMKDARIRDGDLLVVRRQDYARDRDLVLCLLNYKTTHTKRYYEMPNNMVILQPHNLDFKPIIANKEDVVVLGKVIKKISIEEVY